MSGVSLVCWRDLFDSLDDHAIGEAARALSLSAQVLVQSSQVAQRTVLPINPTFRSAMLARADVRSKAAPTLESAGYIQEQQRDFRQFVETVSLPFGFHVLVEVIKLRYQQTGCSP